MSAKGRCAGCLEISELREANLHVVVCPDWAELYRTNRPAALLPKAEYDRWRAEERDGERDARYAGLLSDTSARRAVTADRFRSVDPLGDDE